MSTAQSVHELPPFMGTPPVNQVGAAGLILGQHGELLLVRRGQSQAWSLPGGLCDLGESFEAALHRQLLSTTGLRVQAARLLDVVSGPRTFRYKAGGERYYLYTALYAVQAWTGTPTPGSPTPGNADVTEVRFFPAGTWPELTGPVASRALEYLT